MTTRIQVPHGYGLNKYDELVTHHGPVCAKCHQRIGLGKGWIVIWRTYENYCLHCVAKLEGRS